MLSHVKSPLKHHLGFFYLFQPSNKQIYSTSSNNIGVQLHCTWTTNNTPAAPPVNAHDLNQMTFESKQEQYDKITYYHFLCHANITIDDFQNVQYYLYIYGCFRKYWYPQIIHLFIGFSIIFTIHFGGFPPIFGNTHILQHNMSHRQVSHFVSTHPFPLVSPKLLGQEVVKSFTSVVENCVFGGKGLGVQKVEKKREEMWEIRCFRWKI